MSSPDESFDTDEDQARTKRGPLKRAVAALAGDPGGDKTDPRPPQRWTEPFDEQQTEPGEAEPPTRDSD